ncbi:MAG: conserved repeat domain protein [Conexibacter sp.]|nr:conserved repeat domain protein [Conexibacter sp.]
MLLPAAATVLLAALLAAPAASARRAHAAIVGGAPASIQQVPWQVFLSATGPDESCGGSILDATRVLTAAHCVDPEGTTTPRPPSAFTVLAGFSDVNAYSPGKAPPAGTQVVAVASVRVHPGYVEHPQTDDVAVLTLAQPLNLSGPNAQPIALAPVGGGPAPGTALGFSGYGQENPPAAPDFKLYAAQFPVLGDDSCSTDVSPNASASVICVESPTQSACFGDSGGPLVAANGQVGVASFVESTSCGRGHVGFADVTAPEVRAFIDGSDQPPVAPRQSAVASLNGVSPPVVGSPLTCTPGTWTPGATFGYLFELAATGQVLQSGAGNVFVPRAAQQGQAIVCIVQASNGAGTSTARSGVVPAIAADGVAPRSAIRSVRCRGRSCSVRFDAGDANSAGAVAVGVVARFRVVTRCQVGKGRHRRTVRCTRARSTTFRVAHLSGVHYRASAAPLPYGRVQIRVTAVDAAGNRQRGTTAATVTVRKARAKAKRHR